MDAAEVDVVEVVEEVTKVVSLAAPVSVIIIIAQQNGMLYPLSSENKSVPAGMNVTAVGEWLPSITTKSQQNLLVHVHPTMTPPTPVLIPSC